MRKLSCPNQECHHYNKTKAENIIKHGTFKLKKGKQRRYLCKTCKKTFGTTNDTPYYGIQRTKQTFDDVCSMRVEGLNKSAIARLKNIAWNTVDRWIKKAAEYAKTFSFRHTKHYELKEIQADEIKTFVGNKKKMTWLITGIEVWSRLWPVYELGTRTYRNIKNLFNQLVYQGKVPPIPLITTDGFAPYALAIDKIFNGVCIYGQVIKTRRNNRIVKVERKLIFGTARNLENALFNSEDSHKLNTSFVERHNLTIRQGNAYLHRRTPAHARSTERLREQLDLQQCHYNFIRYHMSLKIGKENKTPAMQAGIAKRRLSFRYIFENLRFYLFVRIWLLKVDRCKIDVQ